jgi:hypothetical protein
MGFYLCGLRKDLLMPKRCIICGEEARFAIKDSSESYCKECAEENFDDVSYLEKV